ncbi:hypothetical protein J437_LFUL016057 [Ladona fulva]|uniref:Uncharacterized protein n=1 Tax=Ladona fulva TaxID=123851 RepID=A0A8K0KLV8_LADFU|nr:hypothetical protein J437_LFUL016057 [Ladona fulva]
MSSARRRWIFPLPYISVLIITLIGISIATEDAESQKCTGGAGLKYMWGDALTDSPDCIGPNGSPYPKAMVARSFRGTPSGSPWSLQAPSYRMGRARQSLATLDPSVTQKVLLRAHQISNGDNSLINTYTLREGRASSLGMNIKKSEPSCGSTPARLCKTRYNTTAPMYGVSLTSGQPVTIVQKFPDLLQQVVFEVCEYVSLMHSSLSLM